MEPAQRSAELGFPDVLLDVSPAANQASMACRSPVVSLAAGW